MPLYIHHIKKHWGMIVGVIVIFATLFIAWTIWHVQPATTPRQPAKNNTSHPSPQPSYVDQKLTSMTVRDKVATLFIFHTPGADPAALAAYQNTYKPAGLIFMGDNIPATNTQLAAETGALVTNKQLPPLLAVDEEGDTVKRLAADTYPGALTLPTLPPSATQTAFSERSDLLKSVGLTLNFGIIADVTSNPNSFIFPRVLGTTPQQAADRVAQAVIGSKGKTLSTLKHFPGHGETVADSHTTIPVASTSYADWLQKDAIPFKAGIAAGADMVMFGQLRYSAIDTAPATLSAKWHDIIRNTLGFKGLIVTDDMIMLQDSGDPTYANPVQNAISAINAGNDLLLYVTDHDGGTTNINPNTLIDGVTAAVTNGQINQSTLDAHVRAVLTTRYNLGHTFYGLTK